jgi:hypothetical protein
VYAFTAINSVPSSLIEPDDFTLRETITTTIAKERRMPTDTYHGTMLNNPVLPSAGDEDIYNKIVLIKPSKLKKFTTT